jgi:hypothetical protein
MRSILALVLMGAAFAAVAETPQQIQQTYAAEAARQQPGFSPSTARGGAFFQKHFGVSAKMPACSSCHTDNPAASGRHAVTGKAIRPLAPSANTERLSDPAQVEKWFGRNCKEVVGRACTPAEKADFVQFLAEVR